MSWLLAIDFGTSYTTAAVALNSGIELVHFGGDAVPRMPSCVYLQEDGTLLTGYAAADQAFVDPTRFEQNPKRWVGDGEIPLGPDDVPAEQAIAAILRTVLDEATLQQGARPAGVVLTHPARWGEHRLDLLRAAAEICGLTVIALLPEPVAAAIHFSQGTDAGSGLVAVYDLGGGTFDSAVLKKDADSFAVAGPPGGIDPMGGEEFDRRLIDYLSQNQTDISAEEWATLRHPTDGAARGRSIDLLSHVKRAKEALSSTESFDVAVPGSNVIIHVTRQELWELVRPDLDATITEFERTIADAGMTARDLGGIYLAGGSSRMPLVKDMMWRRLEVEPRMTREPKATIVLGAAYWGRSRVQSPAVNGPSSTAVIADPGTTAYVTGLRSRLAAEGFAEFAVAPEFGLQGPACLRRKRRVPAFERLGGQTMMDAAMHAVRDVSDSFKLPDVLVFIAQAMESADLASLRSFNEMCCNITAMDPTIQSARGAAGTVTCFGIAVLRTVPDELGASASRARTRELVGGFEFPVVVEAGSGRFWLNLSRDFGVGFPDLLVGVLTPPK